jgi:hypothetical protein
MSLFLFFFYLILDAPLIRTPKKNVYANNFDMVDIVCEVKSNPQSVFAWYFGSKELSASYKHNISTKTYRQTNRAYVDDPENVHHYRSKLTVNALTQFDYGEYSCRSSNSIGESVQTIRLHKKRMFLNLYTL